MFIPCRRIVFSPLWLLTLLSLVVFSALVVLGLFPSLLQAQSGALTALLQGERQYLGTAPNGKGVWMAAYRTAFLPIGSSEHVFFTQQDRYWPKALYDFSGATLYEILPPPKEYWPLDAAEREEDSLEDFRGNAFSSSWMTEQPFNPNTLLIKRAFSSEITATLSADGHTLTIITHTWDMHEARGRHITEAYTWDNGTYRSENSWLPSPMEPWKPEGDKGDENHTLIINNALAWFWRSTQEPLGTSPAGLPLTLVCYDGLLGPPLCFIPLQERNTWPETLVKINSPPYLLEGGRRVSWPDGSTEVLGQNTRSMDEPTGPFTPFQTPVLCWLGANAYVTRAAASADGTMLAVEQKLSTNVISMRLVEVYTWTGDAYRPYDSITYYGEEGGKSLEDHVLPRGDTP